MSQNLQRAGQRPRYVWSPRNMSRNRGILSQEPREIGMVSPTWCPRNPGRRQSASGSFEGPEWCVVYLRRSGFQDLKPTFRSCAPVSIPRLAIFICYLRSCL